MAGRNVVMADHLTDDEIDLLRDVYEAGLELPLRERVRRGLGYKGLAVKFGVPVRTVRDYVSYRRRAYYKGRCADMDDE